MANYKSITKKHEGKRLLVRRAYTSFEQPIEVGVFEISPSGSYVKLQFIRNDNTSYTSWHDHDEYEVLEVLPSKMDRLSDIVEEFNKQIDNKKKIEGEYRKDFAEEVFKKMPKNAATYPYKDYPSSICGCQDIILNPDECGLGATSCCQDNPEAQKQKWVHGMCNPPTKESEKIKAETKTNWNDFFKFKKHE